MSGVSENPDRHVSPIARNDSLAGRNVLRCLRYRLLRPNRSMDCDCKLPAFELRSNYIKPQTPHRTVRLLTPGESPAPGAHLVTPWLGFAHHGLYAGEGRVVHYGALMYDILRKPVEEVTLAQFAGGRAVFVVEHGETCIPAPEAIRRARSRLGEKRYRLFTNNCEHFVEWCLHDVHRSFQAETAMAFPRMLGEWFRARLLRVLQRLVYELTRGTRAIPTRVPVEACAPEPCDRSGPNPARTRTDIDSPCS